jgi:hypothetical protein
MKRPLLTIVDLLVLSIGGSSNMSMDKAVAI